MLRNIDFRKLTANYLRNAIASSANLPLAWIFIESFQQAESNTRRRVEASNIRVDYTVSSVLVVNRKRVTILVQSMQITHIFVGASAS